MQPKNSRRLLLGTVIAVGAALRLYGIWFGLPLHSNFYIRPDESLIVQAAIAFFDRAGNPGFFAYPALLMELCAFVNALALRPFVDFSSNPSAYFLVPRAISVIAGTATIPVVYAIARELVAHRWAVLAAASFAVAPLPMRDAHFGVTDTLMTFFISLALLHAVRYAISSIEERERTARRRFLLGAFFFALALSTKYTAALGGPALIACFVERDSWRNWRTGLRRLVPSALVTGLVFALLNPYVFLRFGQTYETVAGMFRVFYGGSGAGDHYSWSAGGAAWQLLLPLFYGPASWGGLALALASCFWLTPGGRTPKGLLTVILGTFPFLFALLPFQHGLPFRYLLPALPGIAVLAGFGVSRLSNAMGNRCVVAGVSLLVILWQAGQSIALVQVLGREDTRTQAGIWIENQIPPDVPILVLGPPEAEPQIQESARSIDRRIAYVHKLYGEDSGRIVSELYLLIRPTTDDGREVYRDASPEEIPGQRLAIVAPSYPLTLVGQAGVRNASRTGSVESQVVFDPLLGDAAGADFDGIDAFLLPMNPAGRVSRPGPRLTIVLVNRHQTGGSPAITTGR